LVPDDFEARLRAALAGRPPERIQIDDARDAAVLIPIIGDPQPTLIFTVRTDTLSTHKGQISFPGGSIDATDNSVREAALRETQEEIGLDPDVVRILGELDSFPTFVSGYVVSPVIGWLDRPPELKPNPAEVAEILQVPIADLAEDIRQEPGFEHAGRTYPTEAWVWEDRVIWGVTARIIRQFLELLAGADLVERPGSTTSWTAWPMPKSTR
jgi:8-oxo-dGTP pyrophosphatase MutT (NUDIX family)